MIISASRRTDIPAYYSEWFFNRLQEGFCYTIHPMNPKIYYKISLQKNIVDAIVFWSKNPYPMLKKLCLLADYPYYFQYTITPYANDIEKNLPLKKYLIETFIQLSQEIGKNRVIWRYDPILFSPNYTLDFHLENFAQLCQKLAPYTAKVIVSFISMYRKVRKHCEQQNILCPNEEEKRQYSKLLPKYVLKTISNWKSARRNFKIHGNTRYILPTALIYHSSTV